MTAMNTATGDLTRKLVELSEGARVQISDDLEVSGDLMGPPPHDRLDVGFEYLGVPFVVRAQSRDQGIDMEVRASVGVLPFTAEDSERRATALAILNAATADLGGRVRLTPDQRVIIAERLRMDEALTPVALLSRTVKIVLRHKPYIELLSLVVTPPSQAAPATIN